MTTARLADATWEEVADERSPGPPLPSTLAVPVGSLEQHGPHLPLDTDTCIAQAVTEEAAALLTAQGVQAWVGPALAFGSSGEHQSFPGTVSIGSEALEQMVVELVRSARTWVDRVVFVNGHGGNVAALTRAVTKLQHEGHDVTWLPCRTEGVDLHAGRTETSLMLHLRPDAVRLERAAVGDTRPLAEILPLMIAGGVVAVSPNGVLGDPTGASSAEGRALVETMARETADAVLGRSVGAAR